MLGASWRRYEDPARSRDPRVRELVGALSALPTPQPRPEFRAELRAQLVAIAPRIVAESADATAPLIDIVPGKAPAHTGRSTAARPRHTDSLFARIRSVPIGRPLAVAASVITAFALLLGGAVWMSQKALPGDALYGLKRASESFELATAGSDTEKARDYLDFAKTRAAEVQDLLKRSTTSAIGTGPVASGGLDSHTAALIDSTLASADHDVKAAATLLGSQAIKSKSTSPLDVMTSWAPDQLARLHEIAAAAPDSALRRRTESSADLVSAALNRAKQLAPKVGTGCLDTASRDELGPVPVAGCPSGQGPTPTAHPKSTATAHRSKDRNIATNGTSEAPAPNVSSTPGAGQTSPKSSPTPIVSLPTSLLPTSTKSLPVTVDTCGVGISLGPIQIGLGIC